MKLKNALVFWMPNKDETDFMFVQHMVASLNNAGRMAVVMPHGVCIVSGWGGKEIPWVARWSWLFGGSSWFAFCPVLRNRHWCLYFGNQQSRSTRKRPCAVYKCRPWIQRRQNQNKLRPKIWKNCLHLPTQKGNAQIQQVGVKSKSHWRKQQFGERNFNFNIRRFVDNAPPPEPQDVHAPLQGGIPKKWGKSINRLFQLLFRFGSQTVWAVKTQLPKIYRSPCPQRDIKNYLTKA